jgi:alkanesulfonate monooxygenase SsuD/methylene tetrahydromethanopterin reductase-like flavin-dependent oxidoreductase (luciferase family)
MKPLLPTLLGAALLCGALAARAQAPAAPSGEQRARPTPEQREKMREAFKAAREACKDNPDRRACMAQQMCLKAPDPAKCQERAKERQARMMKRMDEHQAAAEACTGKRGDELMKCYREQHKMHHGSKPENKS